jgi:hypothetical protein
MSADVRDQFPGPPFAKTWQNAVAFAPEFWGNRMGSSLVSVVFQHRFASLRVESLVRVGELHLDHHGRVRVQVAPVRPNAFYLRPLDPVSLETVLLQGAAGVVNQLVKLHLNLVDPGSIFDVAQDVGQ